MKLPNWLRPIISIGLGMIFKNNKIPVEISDVIVQSIPMSPPSEKDQQK